MPYHAGGQPERRGREIPSDIRGACTLSSGVSGQLLGSFPHLSGHNHDICKGELSYQSHPTPTGQLQKTVRHRNLHANGAELRVARKRYKIGVARNQYIAMVPMQGAFKPGSPAQRLQSDAKKRHYVIWAQ